MTTFKKQWVLILIIIAVIASIIFIVQTNNNSSPDNESDESLVRIPQQAHKIFGYSIDGEDWSGNIGEYSPIDDKQGQYRLVFSNNTDNSTIEMFYVSSIKTPDSNPTGLDPNQREQFFTATKAKEIGQVDNTTAGIISLQSSPYLGSYEYIVVDINSEITVEGGFIYELETRLFANDTLSLEEYNQSMVITLKLRSIDDAVREKKKSEAIKLINSLQKSEPLYGLDYISDIIQTPFGSNEAIQINQGFSESHQALDIVPSLEYYKSDKLYNYTGLETMYALCSGTAEPFIDQSGAKVIRLQCNESERVIEYWHNETNFVYENQTVQQGQVIGVMGETGNSHGRHLHLVILENGERVDPEKII